MIIQDVERQTGLDRATIRFYEKVGLITPKREENGYRIYCDADVSTLRKTKLLRQLSFSLDSIKRIQQGSADFAAALVEQIEVLEHQIEQSTAAKQVCVSMQNENVQYQTLDAVRYLSMLTADNSVCNGVFKEIVQRESHPWRRYFARFLDYAWISALISTLLVVIIRIRPFSTNALRVLQYLSYLFAMAILAFLQSITGTTPGKWTMGIRIEDSSGGKPSFAAVIYREVMVFAAGIGLNVPFISLWRLFKSYKNETEGEGNSWEEETEIVYTDWNRNKKAAYCILAALSLILSWTASIDSMLPKHRGSEITIDEFVRNYQDYEKVLETQSEYTMMPDGSWKETDNQYQIIISGDGNHVRPDFTYDFDDNGNLKGIHYKDHWNDALFLSPVPAYCKTALYALIGSRPNSSYRDLLQAEALMTSEILNKLTESVKEGSFYGNFQVNDVNISWKIDAENCDVITDMGWMASVGEDALEYDLVLDIEILN